MGYAPLKLVLGEDFQFDGTLREFRALMQQGSLIELVNAARMPVIGPDLDSNTERSDQDYDPVDEVPTREFKTGFQKEE